MADLGTEIFKKYGARSIILVVIAAFCVWGLAHWAASPGTEVSVLWGLVKYTKPLHQSEEIFSHNQHNPTTMGHEVTKIDSLLPVSIDIVNDVDPKKLQEARSYFRNKYKLRQLSALESGKKVSELPIDIYFFLLSTLISEPVCDESIKDCVFALNADRFPEHDYFYFECHLLSNSSLHILGFINQNDAAEISYLSGQTTHKIMLSPSILPSMTSLVSLPIDRMVSSEARFIQITEGGKYPVLDLVVQ